MAIENDILQITEHSLKLDLISILDNESGETAQDKIKPSKILGAVYPFIEINKYEFSYGDIMSFNLINRDFLPVLNLKIVDSDGLFQSRHFALDGAVLNFYIRANNELLHKPIHINFDIINLAPSGIATSGKPVFSITAQMKVPNLYTEYCEAFPDMTSYDILLELSTKLKLGFASNDDSTDDPMTWVNPNDTVLKFIEDITAHSYKNEKSFFTTFIDPYYNLTLVNIDKVYDNQIIDGSEIYSTQIQDLYKGDDTEFEGIPMFFTNLREFNNTSKFITSHRLINRTGEIFLRNGYKRTLQYFDEIENKYIPDVLIDPLSGSEDSKIHLKGRYVDGKIEATQPAIREGAELDRGFENISTREEKTSDDYNQEGHVYLHKQYVKFKFMGKQNENVHDYYLYSNVFNYQNIEESNKLSMEISLYQTDMSIYRYQSVLIQIYEYEKMVKEVMEGGSNSDASQFKDGVESNEGGADSESPKLNEFLSGMYMITGIDYIYRNPGPMYQKVYLSKREFISPA